MRAPWRDQGRTPGRSREGRQLGGRRPQTAGIGHAMTEEEKLTVECAKEARRQAALLPDGPIRDALLEKARLYEAKIPEARAVKTSPALIRPTPIRSSERNRIRCRTESARRGPFQLRGPHGGRRDDAPSPTSERNGSRSRSSAKNFWLTRRAVGFLAKKSFADALELFWSPLNSLSPPHRWPGRLRGPRKQGGRRPGVRRRLVSILLFGGFGYEV
jgi:hypothetical protein